MDKEFVNGSDDSADVVVSGVVVGAEAVVVCVLTFIKKREN